MKSDLNIAATELQKPTLLPRKNVSKAFDGEQLGKIPDFEKDNEVIDTIRQTASAAGIEFLFEIPGTLIADSDPICCALRYWGDEVRHGFVLCDRQSGDLKLVHLDDIPLQAREFFLSLVSVLVRLEAVNANRSLH